MRRVAGVIGDSVGHSISPALHNAAFAEMGLDWTYEAFEVAKGQGASAVDAMRTLHLSGLNITTPHKVAVIEGLDQLSPEAETLGAVNTIVWQGDALMGHNTDVYGFLRSLDEELSFDPFGRRCVVLGAGGAARAVAYGLQSKGAADIAVINRSTERAAGLVSDLGDRVRIGADEDVSSADLIVNATPLGMTGGANGDFMHLEARLHQGQCLYDLVYTPRLSPLMKAAQAEGVLVANGLGMLVHQAAAAFTIWTGVDAPVDAMRQAASSALA